MKVLVITASIGSTSKNKVSGQKGIDVTFKQLDKTNFPTREKVMTNRMIGKIPKMLAWEMYPGYDLYIWIDSYFNLVSEGAIQWFIDQIEDKDALFFKHPNRKTVKEEVTFLMNEIKKNNQYIKDRCEGEDIQGQLDYYLSDPEFNDTFLIAASSFAYKPSLVQNKDWNVMKEWYYQVCRWNVRDQVSLPYVLQKYNVNFKIINDDIFKCKYLK